MPYQQQQQPQGEDNSQGFDRRNNDGIYIKIDTLESKVFQTLNIIQDNQATMKTKIDILNYQVSLINGGLKIFLVTVGLAFLGAILKLVIIG